jgi:hypothetical protein
VKFSIGLVIFLEYELEVFLEYKRLFLMQADKDLLTNRFHLKKNKNKFFIFQFHFPFSINPGLGLAQLG